MSMQFENSGRRRSRPRACRHWSRALASPDAQLRFEAALAIRPFRPQRRAAVPALIEILEKEPVDLEKLGPGKPPDPSWWDGACAAASTLGEVLATLDDTPADHELSREIVASLLRVLESGHPARKFAAIHALKDGRRVTASTAAIPSLIRLMKKMESIEDPFENGPAAANALGFIADRTEVAPSVIQVLRASIASHSRSGPWAIDALQTFGPRAESAIPDLIGVLEQATAEKEEYRNGEAAARALGEISPGTASGEIVVSALARDGLASPSKDVRLAALMSLARFGSGAAAAIPAIRRSERPTKSPKFAEPLPVS